MALEFEGPRELVVSGAGAPEVNGTYVWDGAESSAHRDADPDAPRYASTTPARLAGKHRWGEGDAPVPAGVLYRRDLGDWVLRAPFEFDGRLFWRCHRLLGPTDAEP